MKYKIIYFLIALFPVLGFADSFKCNSSIVDAKLLNGGPFGYEEVVLTVKRDKKDIRLRFNNVHFGVECRKNTENKELIVFQAYCGGSGCRDLDNFGIIDPSDLRVLLVPNDENRKLAKKIFGSEVIPVD